MVSNGIYLYIYIQEYRHPWLKPAYLVKLKRIPLSYIKSTVISISTPELIRSDIFSSNIIAKVSLT